MPCVLFAASPSELRLKGGTNAEMAPQIDYTMMVRAFVVVDKMILYIFLNPFFLFKYTLNVFVLLPVYFCMMSSLFCFCVMIVNSLKHFLRRGQRCGAVGEGSTYECCFEPDY